MAFATQTLHNKQNMQRCLHIMIKSNIGTITHVQNKLWPEVLKLKHVIYNSDMAKQCHH